MKNQVQKFKTLLDLADNILITSHIAPDPDAVCSLLLIGTTLEANFKKKKIALILEEKPSAKLDFLEGFGKILFKSLAEATRQIKPDLFILLDAPKIQRSTRKDDASIKKLLAQLDASIVIIDHHEKHDKDESDVYINNRHPATTQQVYELLFDKLKLKKPNNYAQTALLGIISDTDRFKFDNPYHRQTYKIVSDLLDAGASIEELETKIERYNTNQLKVVNNLISNITDSGKGYTYSFIDDNLANDWLKHNKPIEAYKLACGFFTQTFLKNFENNLWGFVVYRDIAEQTSNIYGVSLRSTAKVKDVAKIANRLGGGGHTPAAGAKILAPNVRDAIKMVESAISGADDED